jgi:hypothetical protein
MNTPYVKNYKTVKSEEFPYRDFTVVANPITGKYQSRSLIGFDEESKKPIFAPNRIERRKAIKAPKSNNRKPKNDRGVISRIKQHFMAALSTIKTKTNEK